MMKYLIALYGCDDEIYYELELSNTELEFLIKISKEINKRRTRSCQPTMHIYKDYEKEESFYKLSKDLAEDDTE